MSNQPSNGGIKELFKGVGEQVVHDLVNLPIDAVREVVGVEKESGKRLDGNESTLALEPNLITDVEKNGSVERMEMDKQRAENEEQSILLKQDKDNSLKDSEEELMSKRLDSSPDQQQAENRVNGYNSQANTTHEFKEQQAVVNDDDDDQVNTDRFKLSNMNNHNRGDVMRLVYDGLSQKTLSTQTEQVRLEEENHRLVVIRDTLGIQNGDLNKKSEMGLEIFAWLHEAVEYGLNAN